MPGNGFAHRPIEDPAGCHDGGDAPRWAEVIEYPGIGHTPPLMVTERINAVTDWLSV